MREAGQQRAALCCKGRTYEKSLAKAIEARDAPPGNRCRAPTCLLRSRGRTFWHKVTLTSSPPQCHRDRLLWHLPCHYRSECGRRLYDGETTVFIARRSHSFGAPPARSLSHPWRTTKGHSYSISRKMAAKLQSRPIHGRIPPQLCGRKISPMTPRLPRNYPTQQSLGMEILSSKAHRPDSRTSLVTNSVCHRCQFRPIGIFTVAMSQSWSS